jgi:hypothetical protein
MHLKATAQNEGLLVGELDELLVVPGTFDFVPEIDRFHSWLQQRDVELASVFVDTSAAYFSGDDENNNVEMRRHASSMRELCSLPGRPTVFVLCHPTKNATRENLLPRGGGAFLAEVDANLTVWKDDAGIVTLSHAGKIRGPSFDPIRFELVPLTLDGVLDCRGQPISSVAAHHLADERAEQLQAKELDDENRLLVAMVRCPEGSIAKLATAAGFTSGGGTPQKSKVARLLQTLHAGKLVEQARGGAWRLTSKGRTEVDGLR